MLVIEQWFEGDKVPGELGTPMVRVVTVDTHFKCDGGSRVRYRHDGDRNANLDGPYGFTTAYLDLDDEDYRATIVCPD